MKRNYFGTDYIWIDEKHEENETRAYRLFRDGRFMVGTRKVMMNPERIEYWKDHQMIKEDK